MSHGLFKLNFLTVILYIFLPVFYSNAVSGQFNGSRTEYELSVLSVEAVPIQSANAICGFSHSETVKGESVETIFHAEHTSRNEYVFPNCSDIKTEFKVKGGTVTVQFCSIVFGWPGGTMSYAMGIFYMGELVSPMTNYPIGYYEPGDYGIAPIVKIKNIPDSILPLTLEWKAGINEGVYCPPTFVHDTSPTYPEFVLIE